MHDPFYFKINAFQPVINKLKCTRALEIRTFNVANILYASYL